MQCLPQIGLTCFFFFFQELFALIYWNEEDSVSVSPEGSIDPSLKDITVGASCRVRIGPKWYSGELAAKGNLTKM